MHDGVDALSDAQRVAHLGNIGLDERLPLGRLHRTLVREPQLVFAGDFAAEVRADVAGRAGDQDCLQTRLPISSLNRAARSKYTECPAAGTRSARPFGASLANAGPAADGKTQSSSPVM